MRTYHTETEDKRMSLILSGALYGELSVAAKEDNSTHVAVIRRAIEGWLEERKIAKMREGYLAMAEEDMKIMEEFKYVDRENW